MKRAIICGVLLFIYVCLTIIGHLADIHVLDHIANLFLFPGLYLLATWNNKATRNSKDTD